MKKKNNRASSQYALFCLIVISCLGEAINLFGIKMAWVMAILTIILFTLENINKKISISTYNTKVFIVFFCIWVIYATIQMAFISNNQYAFSNYLSLIINVFLVIIISLSIQTVDDLIFINWGLILGLLINLVIAMWEIFTGNHIVTIAVENQLNYINVPVSVFVNENDLATFICLGVVSVVLNFSLEKRHKTMTTITIIASIFVLYKIDARAPIYGLAIYGISFALIHILLKLFRHNESIFAMIAIITVFLITMVGTIVLVNYSIKELVIMISSSGNIESDIYRLSIIEAAFKGLINSAFLGVGPGQSITLMNINVHNFFLEIMCEYGIFIITGILIIFFSFLRAYRWKLPEMLTLCIMSFPFGFAIISISSSSANRIRATWIIITLLYIALNICKKELPKGFRNGKAHKAAKI